MPDEEQYTGPPPEPRRWSPQEITSFRRTAGQYSRRQLEEITVEAINREQLQPPEPEALRNPMRDNDGNPLTIMGIPVRMVDTLGPDEPSPLIYTEPGGPVDRPTGGWRSGLFDFDGFRWNDASMLIVDTHHLWMAWHARHGDLAAAAILNARRITIRDADGRQYWPIAEAHHDARGQTEAHPGPAAEDSQPRGGGQERHPPGGAGD